MMYVCVYVAMYVATQFKIIDFENGSSNLA